MENQSGPVLETVRVRVSTPEWVLAKYCVDNGITRITAREIKTALGIRNLLSLYNLIHIAIRDGLLKSVKKFSGVYEVNVKQAMALTQLIPYDAGDRTTNLSDIPQWKQAIAYAKAWQTLAEWARKALKGASEGTSPPAPVAKAKAGKGEGGEPVSGSGCGGASSYSYGYRYLPSWPPPCGYQPYTHRLRSYPQWQACPGGSPG